VHDGMGRDQKRTNGRIHQNIFERAGHMCGDRTGNLETDGGKASVFSKRKQSGESGRGGKGPGTHLKDGREAADLRRNSRKNHRLEGEKGRCRRRKGQGRETAPMKKQEILNGGPIGVSERGKAGSLGSVGMQKKKGKVELALKMRGKKGEATWQGNGTFGGWHRG